MTQPPGTRGLLNAIRLRWIANWRVALAFGLGLVLSVVSFFTTLEGLVAFTAPSEETRGLLAWLLAGGATLGIQFVLLLSAWMVGTALVQAVDPHRPWASRLYVISGAGLWFLMFGLTLLASVFFSYHTFYSRISAFYPSERAPGSKSAAPTTVMSSSRSPHVESLALLHVRKTVEPLLSQMREAAENRRRWYLDAFSLPENQLSEGAREIYKNSADYKTAYPAWDKYMTRMGELADDAETLIAAVRIRDHEQEAARKKAAQERAADEAKRTVTLELAGQKLDSADREVERVSDEIHRFQEMIDELQTSVSKEKRQRDHAKETMNCEEKGSKICPDATGKAGRGLRYLTAKRDYDASVLNIRDKQGKIDDAKAEVSRLQTQRAHAQEVIAANKGTTKQYERTLDVSPSTAEASPFTAPELEFLVASIRKALSSLTDPATFGEVAEPRGGAAEAQNTKTSGNGGSATLDSLQQDCLQIHARLLTPELRPYFRQSGDIAAVQGAQAIQCDRSGFQEAIDRVQGLNTGLRRFAESGCQSLTGSHSGQGTADIIRHAEDCLALLDLDPTFTTEIIAELSQLGRNHSIAVHPFVPSLLGLTTYQDPLAYLSLFIAAMIDLLVFFAGIVGGHESLRRIDRIGQELRGDDALIFGLATLREERPTDSEKIRLWRQLLRHFVVRELSPAAAAAATYPKSPNWSQRLWRLFGSSSEDQPIPSHIRYIGYIEEDALLSGSDADESLLGTIHIWMCTPKSNVDVILRTPRDDPDPKHLKPGPFDPLLEADDEPVRYYFLRELILDMAEDIIHWDRAHARHSDGPSADFDDVRGRRGRSRLTRTVQRAEPRITPIGNHLRSVALSPASDAAGNSADPDRAVHVRTPGTAS